MLCYQLIN